MSRLTPDQLHLLQIIADADKPLTGLDLAQLFGENKGPEGAHQTAASLSRRGLVLKNKEYRLGHPKVVYSITPAGRHTLAEESKKRSTIRRSKE